MGGEELSNKNSTFIAVKRDYFGLRVSPEAPFYWKLFKIGIRSAKDIRKDVLIFQVKGSAPAPPTPPVFRVVLYHTEASGQRLLRHSVILLSKFCKVKDNSWVLLVRKFVLYSMVFIFSTFVKTKTCQNVCNLVTLENRFTIFKRGPWRFTLCQSFSFKFWKIFPRNSKLAFWIYYQRHRTSVVREFSASRHFFKTKVTKSVAEFILYTQTTRKCGHFLSNLVN